MGRSASYRSSLPKHRLALIGPSFLAESRTSAILRLLRACTLTSVTAPASPMIAMITVEPIQNWQAWLVVGGWIGCATSTCRVIACVMDPLVAFTFIQYVPEGPALSVTVMASDCSEPGWAMRVD